MGEFGHLGFERVLTDHMDLEWIQAALLEGVRWKLRLMGINTLC